MVKADAWRTARVVEETKPRIVRVVEETKPRIVIEGDQAIFLSWLARSWRNDIAVMFRGDRYRVAAEAFPERIDALLHDISEATQDRTVFPDFIVGDKRKLR